MFLIITACLLSQPTECKDHYIQIFEEINEQQCMAQAMVTVAKWTGDHYEWTPKGWKCSKV